MNHISFGSILREARVAKGLDIATVSQNLRIRSDIIQAIESSDFARMPPRGYSRNMINAYARFLGIDSNSVTRMYLDEDYAFQIEQAHQKSTLNRYQNQNTSAATSRRSSRQTTSSMPAVDDQRSARYPGRGKQTARGRILYDERDEMSYNAPAESRGYDSRSKRDYRQSGARSGGGLYDQTQIHRARREAISDGKYYNVYSSHSYNSARQTISPRTIIIAVVAIIILVVIIFNIVSCATKPQEQTNIPVTGAAGEQNEGQDNQQAPQPPTSFTVSFEVPDGKTAYIEVYVDDSTEVADDITGPATQEFTSSDTIRFVTSNPENVVVKVDGQEQKLEANSRGIVNTTFSFSEILKQWYDDHPDVQKPASLNNSSNTSGSNSSSSSNNSSSSNKSESSNSNSSSSGSNSSQSNDSDSNE